MVVPTSRGIQRHQKTGLPHYLKAVWRRFCLSFLSPLKMLLDFFLVSRWGRRRHVSKKKKSVSHHFMLYPTITFCLLARLYVFWSRNPCWDTHTVKKRESFWARRGECILHKHHSFQHLWVNAADTRGPHIHMYPNFACVLCESTKLESFHSFWNGPLPRKNEMGNRIEKS